MILWLVGMMGAGKTSAGRLAARRLGVRFVDLDEEIERVAGISVTDIWAAKGEAHFRELESTAVERVAGSAGIVATGGGAVLDLSNRERMRRSGKVVWLQAGTAELLGRLGAGVGRPLLEGGGDREEKLASILVERSAAYADAADYELDTSGLSVDEVAMKIEELWRS